MAADVPAWSRRFGELRRVWTHPGVLDLQSTAAGIDVRSVQGSFGLLSTVDGLEPAERGVKERTPLQLPSSSPTHRLRILHHRLDSVAFKDDDPQHVSNGVAHGVEDLLEQRDQIMVWARTWAPIKATGGVAMFTVVIG